MSFSSVFARSAAVGVVLFLVSLTATSAAGTEVNNEAKQAARPHNNHTLWIIPHTHWEGAIFETREEYLDIALPHILNVLCLLQKYSL